MRQLQEAVSSTKGCVKATVYITSQRAFRSSLSVLLGFLTRGGLSSNNTVSRGEKVERNGISSTHSSIAASSRCIRMPDCIIGVALHFAAIPRSSQCRKRRVLCASAPDSWLISVPEGALVVGTSNVDVLHVLSARMVI